MKLAKVNYKLVVILLASLLFRLTIIPAVFHPDIISQAGWGQNIAYNGTKSFYTNRVWTFSWPNHPPLVSLYYGLCFDVYRQLSLRFHHVQLLLNKLNIRNTSYSGFVDSLDKMVSPEIPFPKGYMLSLKLVPVIVDILVGVLIYFYAGKLGKNKYWYTIIYLISPFTWYISALWGQTDQLAFLLVFLGFTLLQNKPFIAIFVFYLGVSIKPTGMLLSPLYIFFIIKFGNKRKMIGSGIIFSMIFNFFLFKLFSDRNYFDFIFQVLLPRIFDRVPRLTTNAYNFWHILALDRGLSDDILVFKLPALFWGMVCFGIVNLWGFRVINKDLKSIISAIFIVSLGGWLFLTDMLDRYSYMGIVSGLMVCAYRPRLLKYWLTLSLIYWLNIFRGWWFPESLYYLKYFLTGKNYLAGLFLSSMNVLVYLVMVKKIFGETFEKSR